MARLTAADRAKVPAGEFGVPSLAGTAKEKKKSGNYPMPDKSHARAAKSMAARFASPSVKARVDAKADRILGKDKAKGK